ncbi:MAG: hypothetical protein HPY83_00175 [Anaerolineae bacterium]|nr:hypothetical protein [Anaerolineae bacterium]
MRQAPPATQWERWALPLLLALGLAHGVAYAVMVPPWQAPDEPGHFEHVRLLAQQWRFTSAVAPDPALEREIIASLYANHYWDFVPHPMPQDLPGRLSDLDTFAGRSRTLARPSLSYVPYALVVWPLRHQDVDLQLTVLRLFSALQLPLVVYMGWRCARTLFPDDIGPALVVGGFAALLPQHAHLMASVSDGNLAEVLASAYFLVTAVAARRGLTLRRALTLGMLAMLALASKNTALFLVPTTVVALPVLARRRRVRGWAWLAGGVGALALVLVGIRFAPRKVQVRSLIASWESLVLPASYAPDRLGHYWIWCVMTFESFWGRFGWMNVRMGDAAYVVLAGLTAAAAVGVMARSVLPQLRSRLRPGAGWCLGLYALSVAFALAFVLGTFVVYYSPYGNFSQGRYLFPALLPLAVLAGYGTGASALHRFGRASAVLVVGALAILSLHALFGTVAPTFLWGN